MLSLRQQIASLVMGLSCVLSACNLQQTPLKATTTLIPTPTAFDQATRTPINQPPSQSSLSAPPLPGFQTPTALPLGASSTRGNGTAIPTVSTQQASQRYEIQARAGKTVGLNYVITLTMGSVTLTMQGTGGVVWQKTFTASETGRAEVMVEQGGTYEVMAQIDRFEGNYQLGWD